MRTVELSDEAFACAEREASERGVPVSEWVSQVLIQGAPLNGAKKGGRVQFPIFSSKAPGTLNLTKEMIDAVELEDDLRRSGL